MIGSQFGQGRTKVLKFHMALLGGVRRKRSCVNPLGIGDFPFELTKFRIELIA